MILLASLSTALELGTQIRWYSVRTIGTTVCEPFLVGGKYLRVAIEAV